MFQYDDLEFNPKGNNLIERELAVSGLESHGILDFLTGGASSQNKYAREVAKRTNEYNQAVYKFEGEEMERGYNYAVETQDIKRANLERDIRYEENSAQQRWNYGMAIRDYEHSRDLGSYQQSLTQATAQKGFNEIADGFANLQQDRNKMEQQIELGLTEQETYLNYTAQAYGLQMKKKKLKSGAMSQMRQSSIAALKAKGQAASRGQAGRSVGKSLHAIQMEANITENDIVNELMDNMSQVDMDLLVARHQNMQDNLALELSRNNLEAADSLSRVQISMQRAQADLDAEASIMLKPEIAPPLPTPLTMPRPEYMDIYKPKQGPEPMEAVPYQANLGTAFFNQMLNLAGTAVTLGMKPPFA